MIWPLNLLPLLFLHLRLFHFIYYTCYMYYITASVPGVGASPYIYMAFTAAVVCYLISTAALLQQLPILVYCFCGYWYCFIATSLLLQLLLTLLTASAAASALALMICTCVWLLLLLLAARGCSSWRWCRRAVTQCRAAARALPTLNTSHAGSGESERRRERRGHE